MRCTPVQPGSLFVLSRFGVVSYHQADKPTAAGMSYVFALALSMIPSWAILAVPFLMGCDRLPYATAGAVPTTNAADVSTKRDSAAKPAPVPGFKDFSKSNAVTLLLAEAAPEDGLKHSFREKDGLTTIVKVGELPCRLLNMKETRQEAYLYFTIDPAFKKNDMRNVKIEVEYFDGVFDDNPAAFGIHYDGRGVARGSNPAYKPASQTARLSGSDAWRVATFQVRDAAFMNSQNGRSDFRISVRPPELYVRRVTVTRENLKPVLNYDQRKLLPAVDDRNTAVTP